ncbi:MAG: hypothetical protein J2P25_26410, partial [Nocardiopsaceae bacterium]|nr:hypothetical protein [Nocardiopsaceae bacterium]
MRSRLLWPAVGLAAMLGVLAGAATHEGAVITADLRRFLTFYAGVFALVGFTAVIGAGLATTDRLVLRPGARVVMQAAHRALSVLSTGFLATHIALEVLAGRASLVQVAVPLGSGWWLDVGVAASDLLVLVAAIGVFRARFTTHPRLWRVLHASAYLWWPLAILHGLEAGRQPKPYVTFSYEACVALVAAALLIRLLARARPRQRTPGTRLVG